MITLRFLLHNLDHFWKRLSAVFFIGLLDSIFLFFIPVVLSRFTKDGFTPEMLAGSLIVISLLYLGTLISQWIIRKYGESIAREFGDYAKMKYFKRIVALPGRKLIEHHSGNILSLFNQVGRGLNPVIFVVIWSIPRSIATLTLFFIFTMQESVSVALINAGILLSFVVAGVFLARNITPLAKSLNKSRADLLEGYSDFLSNIFTVKKLGVHTFAEKKLQDKTDAQYKEIRRFQSFHANRWFILQGLYGFSVVLTLGFLLWELSENLITPATLILFIGALNMLRGAINPLAEGLLNFMETGAYISRLEEVLEHDGKKSAGVSIKNWRKISFKKVFFEYPKTGKYIQIPELAIHKGEIVGIVGKSGEGKSTLLGLISNFFHSQNGERYVDQKPFHTIHSDFFVEKFTTVSQEVELFNLSLRENISLGKNISKKNIQELLKEVDLLDWANSLKDGIDTQVGEKGVRLSVGQKQRINLIRSLILNREVYLLDEPTSHLDARTEKIVIQFLKKHLTGKTAIIVTHREKVQSICDTIYSFKNHTLRE